MKKRRAGGPHRPPTRRGPIPKKSRALSVLEYRAEHTVVVGLLASVGGLSRGRLRFTYSYRSR